MKKRCFAILLALVLALSATALGDEWRSWDTTSGGTYEGYANADGQAHGFGILTMSNGNTYYGMFEKGNLTGYGVMLGGPDSSFIVMEGTWLEGRLHGKDCHIHYTNDTVVEGEFSHGEGVKTSRAEAWGLYRLHVRGLRLGDGSIYTGEYNTAGDVFFSYGYGVRWFPDGSIHIGAFANEGFRPGGYGIHVDADLTVHENVWSGPHSFSNVAVGNEEAKVASAGGAYLGRDGTQSSQAQTRCLVCSSIKPGQKQCNDCRGDGKITVRVKNPYGWKGKTTEDGYHYEDQRCNPCNGSGWVDCTSCHGVGWK